MSESCITITAGGSSICVELFKVDVLCNGELFSVTEESITSMAVIAVDVIAVVDVAVVVVDAIDDNDSDAHRSKTVVKSPCSIFTFPLLCKSLEGRRCTPPVIGTSCGLDVVVVVADGVAGVVLVSSIQMLGKSSSIRMTEGEKPVKAGRRSFDNNERESSSSKLFLLTLLV